MDLRAPKDITACRAYFEVPQSPRQRQYEALRAYFLAGLSSEDAAKRFGYTVGTFRVMCHHFRRTVDPAFFAEAKPGPRFQPKKSEARSRTVELRKKNHSVYEISEILAEEGLVLSPTAVREVLRRRDPDPPGIAICALCGLWFRAIGARIAAGGFSDGGLWTVMSLVGTKRGGWRAIKLR